MKRISNDTRDLTVDIAVPVALVVVMLVIIAILSIKTFVIILEVLLALLVLSASFIYFAITVQKLTLKIINHINERYTKGEE